MAESADDKDGVSWADLNRSPIPLGGANMLLVVEDEPDDYILLKRALGKVGAIAAVRWAQTGAEALAVLAETRPCGSGVCVVADVKLPGIDGFDLLQSIKSQNGFGRVKFAFLTGRRDPSTEDRARACGADAFFVKPTSGAQLMEIAKALQRMASQFPSA